MDIRIVQRDRSTTVVHPEWTIKTYREPSMAQREIQMITTYYWAAPEILHINVETGTLITRTMRMYADMPDQQDPQGLYRLLRKLERAGVHHRDVHPGNLAAGPQGPLLIDWEAALDACDGVPPADGPDRPFCSYDLYGPERSQIAPPMIHRGTAGGGPMWWMADNPNSIWHRWGVSVAEAQMAVAAAS